MVEATTQEPRLCVAAWRGTEGMAGSFRLITMDRDYIKACTMAFLTEYARKYGSPDRVKTWIE